ncbi:MAG: DegT/DnrJ/EryC1/StrS family aminotransferase [Desulfobacterota bacterium]|nr:DegT/DnrJ/EryC1/StrS family aminotransferase [Thermodesulfobacteriota bacterium]
MARSHPYALLGNSMMERIIPFGKPIIGAEEKQAVLEVLDSPTLVHGPKAVAFEHDFAAFTGAPYAVSVANCTAAMHLFYFSMGLGCGDEVIVPAQTHTATAHAVELTGARPVFVDAEPRTGNIDIEQIESAITPRTRAIAVVHFLGAPVAMERVVAIAQKYGLRVVEDCALALGTRINGRHAGLYGDCGCFSFYPVKHMTTAEGGMLVTRDETIAARVRAQRAFSVDRNAGERILPGMYEVTGLGFNYRMSELQAALGIEQLKRVNTFLEIRKRNYELLAQELADIDELEVLQGDHSGTQCSYYCLSVLVKEGSAHKRNEIMLGLKRNGIGTSIYYPKPVPHMAYYRTKYGYTDRDFPVAARISSRTIALPVGPHLTSDDMRYIAAGLKKTIREVR